MATQQCDLPNSEASIQNVRIELFREFHPSSKVPTIKSGVHPVPEVSCFQVLGKHKSGSNSSDELISVSIVSLPVTQRTPIAIIRAL